MAYLEPHVYKLFKDSGSTGWKLSTRPQILIIRLSLEKKKSEHSNSFYYNLFLCSQRLSTTNTRHFIMFHSWSTRDASGINNLLSLALLYIDEGKSLFVNGSKMPECINFPLNNQKYGKWKTVIMVTVKRRKSANPISASYIGSTHFPLCPQHQGMVGGAQSAVQWWCIIILHAYYICVCVIHIICIYICNMYIHITIHM